MHGPADLRSFFDVAQVDGVVEQEHQPVQGVAWQSVDAGLAGEEQGTAPRPDKSDEAAHVGGEAVLLAVGERQLGQAVDDDSADLAPADLRAHGRGQDIEVQIAHRDVGDHELPGIAVSRDIPAEAGGHAAQLSSGVLERDVEAVFFPFYSLDEPAEPEDRLADAGGAGATIMAFTINAFPGSPS